MDPLTTVEALAKLIDHPLVRSLPMNR